jgi:hypothetical protein
MDKPTKRREREEEAGDSGNESADLMEKDEEEEELDRLVLGSGADFKAQLSQGMDIDSEEESAEEDEEAKAEDAGLENVDDADVSTPPSLQGPN